MDMSLDNVPVDGGTARDYQVYLSEEHYIPGFNKELHGLKAGDEKKILIIFSGFPLPKNVSW
jgi:FKBP-type peptidyl-prolyl cis-trans isomerase (trigger factor)